MYFRKIYTAPTNKDCTPKVIDTIPKLVDDVIKIKLKH